MKVKVSMQLESVKRFAVQNKEALFLGFLGACVIGTVIWKMHQSVEPPRDALVVDKVKQLDLEGLEKLFESKATPNAKDEFGTPVLIWVIVNSLLLGSKAKKVFDCLIQHKADVNAVDVIGRSALHYAAMLPSDFSYFAEQLVEKQASKDLKDQQGFYPQGYASNKEIIGLLQSSIDDDEKKLRNEGEELRHERDKVTKRLAEVQKALMLAQLKTEGNQ